MLIGVTVLTGVALAVAVRVSREPAVLQQRRNAVEAHAAERNSADCSVGRAGRCRELGIEAAAQGEVHLDAIGELGVVQLDLSLTGDLRTSLQRRWQNDSG